MDYISVVQTQNVQPVVKENVDSQEDPPVFDGEDMSGAMVHYKGQPCTSSEAVEIRERSSSGGTKHL